MRRQIISTLTVGILCAVLSLPVQATARHERSVTKRVANFCAAALASTAVALATAYTVTGKLDQPGFGSRVFWNNERRAVVHLLVKALKLRGGEEDELFRTLQIVEISGEHVKGYGMIGGQAVGIEMTRPQDGSSRYFVTISPL